MDAKTGPGRLQDIELLAQTATLLMGAADRGLAGQIGHVAACFDLDKTARDRLVGIAESFWRVQAKLRLIQGEAGADLSGAGASGFLLRDSGQGSIADLGAELEASAAWVEALVSRCLGSGAPRA